MINQFPIIKRIIYDCFSIKVGFGRDGGFTTLMEIIDTGHLKVEDIKVELELLLKSNIDWKQFGIDTYLLPNMPAYNGDFTKNYLLFCISDALWPDKALTMSDREELVVAAYNILKNHYKDSGDRWLFYEEIYNRLIILKAFEKLEFFNVNHIFIDGRGVIDSRSVEKGGELLFQMGIVKEFLDKDVYEVREPNRPYPPYLL